MSAYERRKIQNTIVSRVWQSCLQRFRLVHVKYLSLNTQIIISTVKVFLRSLISKSLANFKRHQTLTAWPFSVLLFPLRKVILAVWTSKRRSASAYESWPLRGGLNCRVLVEEMPGPKLLFSIHLWEMSAYGRCRLAEVRLYIKFQLTFNLFSS